MQAKNKSKKELLVITKKYIFIVLSSETHMPYIYIN